MKQYRIRLDNELKSNKNILIEINQSLLRNYAVLELSSDFRQQPTGEETLEKYKLDSLIALDSTFTKMFVIDKIFPSDQVKISLRLIFNWLSRKIQELKGEK